MYKWYELYSQLAILLLKFCQEDPHTVGQRLFQLCSKFPDFIEFNEWFRDYKKHYAVKSIDPIHLFSRLYEPKLQDKFKVWRMQSCFGLLGDKRKIEKIDFTGCPLPVSQKIRSVRNSRQQKEIWEMFQKVMEQKQQALDEEMFKQARKWYGSDLTSFTIFLFWIDSANFLALDKDSYKLLRETGIMTSSLNNYKDYQKLLPESNTELYRQIVRNAIDLTKDHKKTLDYGKQIARYFITSSKIESRSDLRDFRIIAIRPLKGTNPRLLKILKPDQYYIFYKAYEFSKSGVITFDVSKAVNLYSRDNFNINISAIVGKNGSGKSTITELLYMAINNIACRLYNKYNLLEPVEGFKLELYFKSDYLYKFVIDGKRIEIFQFAETEGGKKFAGEKKIDPRKFSAEQFFHCLSLNYSHYALNSTSMGPWLQRLFNSGDDYNVPFTINPYRNKGNIDINEENELIISRLMASVLEPVLEEGDDNMRRLTDRNQKVTKIKFSLPEGEINEYIKINRGWKSRNGQSALKKVIAYFKLSPRKTRPKLYDIAKFYLYDLLLEISNSYPRYHKFNNFRGDGGFYLSTLNNFLKQIDEDHSHITYKFKKIINFLKYDTLFNLELDTFIDVNTLSHRIQDIKKDIRSDFDPKTIEFISPFFLRATLQLSDGSDFNDLSSGEKQKIFTMNSLAWHITNLDASHSNENLFKYRYINIVFDEVELYFHPDMQRNFINDLLKYLDKIKLEYIDGINFCFITHSPFILSDIPVDNILFLQSNLSDNEKLNGLKTFGANIHELLVNGFFMGQTLGTFASEEIKKILLFHQEVSKNIDGESIDSFKKQYETRKKKFYFLRDNIGEKYISNLISNHIEDIERILKVDSFLLKELKRLDNERSTIKARLHAQD